MKDFEQVFAAIARTTADAIISADSSGNIVAWNPAAKKVLGYTEAEAMGQPLTIVVPERFHEAHTAGIARVVTTGQTHIIGKTVEVAAVHKDGHEIPVELSLSNWTSEGQTFFTAIMRDITRQKDLVNQLQGSEHRLSAVLESANDAIITINAEGVVQSWNGHAEKLLGHSSAEMVGAPLDVIVPEKFRDLHRAGIKRVASGGDTHVIGNTVELAALHADGHEIPIELSLAKWTDQGSVCFTGIIRDVSSRHQMMAEIKRNQQRLAAVLDSANDAIITIDAEGVIQSWNGFAEKLFGRSGAEMIGGPLDVILPEKFRDLHRAGIKRVAGGGETHVIGNTVELSAIHADGHEFPIELSLARWDDGEQTFFSGIIRDITERKAAQAELEKSNAELAEKSSMLESLSAKLAKYLSRQVYDSIFEGKNEVKVSSYRKKLTIFFSDIQGFTELSDRLEPEPVSALLNEYLSEMSKISLEYGGTVDKFIGDGIMIFFGDPESAGEREDAIACARMALAMREKIAELQKSWEKSAGSTKLHVRIGINTGFCTVGNFGSSDRLDYTIVGREVNTASRLESTAQADQIQISDDTYQLIKDCFRCEPLGELRVKGLAYPLKTYALIDSADTPLPEPVPAPSLFKLDLPLEDMSEAEILEAQQRLQKALESRTKASKVTELE